MSFTGSAPAPCKELGYFFSSGRGFLSFILAINLESLDLCPLHPVLEGETYIDHKKRKATVLERATSRSVSPFTENKIT
jgi:hypothetical protein